MLAHRFRLTWLAPLGLAAALLLAPASAPAKHSFRIHFQDQTEIVRDVDTFEVVKVGGGFAALKLVPEQPDIAQTLLQLGVKKKLGEVPVPGEATWLAYVRGSNLAIVRLATTLSEADVPLGTVVLSVRPDPKPLSDVDGAIEGSKALLDLGYPDEARALLDGFASDPKYETDRCRLLKSLLDLQMPAAPTKGEILPEDCEKTIRAILSNCSGVEADTAAQRYSKWTLDRLAQIREAGTGIPEQKTLIQDAISLVDARLGGDQLYLALARLYERNGDAEEGSRVLEQFFKKFPTSSVKEEARQLQDALARRAPARGYRSLGALGTEAVTRALALRDVTDLTFDAEGRLLLLDGSSKPRKLVILTLDPAKRTYEVADSFSLYQKWDPIAVATAPNGYTYFIDSDEGQLVAINPTNDPGAEQLFVARGEGWKLRNPKKVCVVGSQEALVLDVSGEALFRYDLSDQQYKGSIDLEARDLTNPVDVACAPDGKVVVANAEEFSVFDADQGPSALRRAMRGRTFQMEVNRVGVCRWKYVYLFDARAQRLEKFSRSGEWLTTVIDCAKEGIRSPGVWAVNREGEVLIYDRKTDQFYYFTQ